MAFLLKHFCLLLIRLYQASAGFWLRPRCRFWPTCSEYTHEAIQTHGAARGTVLGLKRLLRCHPLGKAGFDPVPMVKK